MLNQHQKHILAVAILTVAAYSLPQVKDVFAETNSNTQACPTGYTCKPIVEQPAGCPVGYICSKIEQKVVSPSFKIEDTTSGKEEKKSSASDLDQKKYCYTFNNDLDPLNLSRGVSIEKDSGIALFNLQTLLEDKEKIDINNSEREFKNPVFGDSTKLAVKEFQRKNGIPVTGYVGPMTRARLNKVYGCDNNISNFKPLITPAVANPNVGPKPPVVPPVAEKTLYYANANIADVKLVNKTTGVQVTENTSVTKGETYTVSWNASGVPESARFTLIFQSPSNPNIYGVLRTGYIDATKRSYDWKVEDYMLTNTDLKIGVEVGNVRVFSPSFKIVAGAVTTQAVTNTQASISSYLLNSFDDKAGMWDKFVSGPGYANRNRSDWNIALTVVPANSNVDISSITVTHDNGYEGWSTGVANVYGKAPYPLVVVNGNTGLQVNSSYDQTIVLPKNGTSSFFKLYAQVETETFSGATVTVKFTDGTIASTHIGASTIKPPVLTDSINAGVQPAVVVAPGIKSIYPASGAPGTKVVLTLNNPNKSSVSLGDFNFGSYGFNNFTNSNNEVITFTVPTDAKPGYYDVVWWGDDAYVVKFNVISQSAPVSKSTGWHYVASVFDSVISLASLIM